MRLANQNESMIIQNLEAIEIIITVELDDRLISVISPISSVSGDENWVYFFGHQRHLGRLPFHRQLSSLSQAKHLQKMSASRFDKFISHLGQHIIYGVGEHHMSVQLTAMPGSPISPGTPITPLNPGLPCNGKEERIFIQILNEAETNFLPSFSKSKFGSASQLQGQLQVTHFLSNG